MLDNSDNLKNGTTRRGVLRGLGLTFGSLCVGSFLTGCDTQTDHKPPFSSLNDGEVKNGISLTDKQRKLILIKDSLGKLEDSFNGLRGFVDSYASRGEAVFADQSLVARQIALISTTKGVLIDMQDEAKFASLKNHIGGLFTALTDLEYQLKITTPKVESDPNAKFAGIDSALDAEERLELMVKVLKADAQALEQAKEKPVSTGSGNQHSSFFYPYYLYSSGMHGESYGYSRGYHYGSQSLGIQERLSNSPKLSPSRSGVSGRSATQSGSNFRAGSGAGSPSSSGRATGGFGGRGVSSGG